MGQVKFGTKQLKNPTPHNVSMLFDFLTGVLGVISAFITTAAFVPHHVSDIITPIITALLMPLLLLAKRFFGVPQTDEEVPTEEVKEIETKPNTDK